MKKLLFSHKRHRNSRLEINNEKIGLMGGLGPASTVDYYMENVKDAEETNENHKIFIERVEDEYYVRIEHDMTKNHYISFIAAISSDRMQMIKLYPEGNAEARFKVSGVQRIYFYCNRDGLFYINPIK